MYQIDVMSRVPVYEQIINQTEKFVLTGVLSGGDKVPSVRSLSMQLSVNPNTIQKAINELDRRGIIFSVPGKGCFVSDNAREVLEHTRRKDLTKLSDDIVELKLAGIKREEIISVVDEIYGSKGMVENND